MSADAKIRQMQAVAKAMRTAAQHGAQAYANGIAGEAPIVDQHFTAGNQQRYSWAPLSREYFLAKQRGISGKVKRGVYYPGKGKQGSKLDAAAEFVESLGETLGIGVGRNAPMLVLKGDLRAAVSKVKNHPIRMAGESAVATFRNLPEYAIYLHLGDGTPQRSPVAPNELDRQQVVAAMRRFIDAAMATGGKVAQTGGQIPGRARFV